MGEAQNTASPLVYNKYGVTRDGFPQRAGSPNLNGGGAAAGVPPKRRVAGNYRISR